MHKNQIGLLEIQIIFQMLYERRGRCRKNGLLLALDIEFNDALILEIIKCDPSALVRCGFLQLGQFITQFVILDIIFDRLPLAKIF